MKEKYEREVDYALIYKYAETRDEAYLDAFMQSEEAEVLSIHILRFMHREYNFYVQFNPNAETISTLDVYNTELLGEVYLRLRQVLYNYKEGNNAKPSTYVFKYVPKQVMRIYTLNIKGDTNLVSLDRTLADEETTFIELQEYPQTSTLNEEILSFLEYVAEVSPVEDSKEIMEYEIHGKVAPQFEGLPKSTFSLKRRRLKTYIRENHQDFYEDMRRRLDEHTR